MPELQEGLFDLPPGARQPRTRVVLLAGPSGSGKTLLTRRLGLPHVALDNFYLDGDHPGLPRRYGIVDWDDPRSWNQREAMATLLELVRSGRAEVPRYDIPTNRRTSTGLLDLGGAPLVIAEGIFAGELIAPCREEDILADGLCLWRPRAQTFMLRLLRDLGEARKSPLTLVRRGLSHARHEPAMIDRLVAQGARRIRMAEAEVYIRHLAQAMASLGTGAQR